MTPAVNCLVRCLLAGLILISASAATAASTNATWFARVWQSEDGLPNNTVTALAQTPDGYLWVATPVGLARFDGVRFEEYSPTNYVAEPNRGVLALVQARSGDLWLAMDRGPIVRLNSGAAQVFLPANGLPDRTAQKLVEDMEGAMWVAYRGGIVCRIKDGKVASFGMQEGVQRALVYSLVTDTKGRVWLADGHQLSVFREGRFQKVLELSAATTCLAPARSGGIWICAGLRLFRFDEGGSLEDRGVFEAGRAGTEPNVLLEDHNGTVWIGTAFNGLIRYDGASFEGVTTSHRGILSLAEDREGNLWVGTGGGGLNRVRMRAVELEGEESGLPFEAVQSLSEATDGTLWATTQNGLLVSRTSGRWNTVPTPGAGITCVTSDANGAVWIGTQNRQLHRWQDGHLTTWGKAEGLEGRILHSLLVSSTGDLWIGGPSDAVQCLRAGTLCTLKFPTDTGAVRTMVEDAAKNIWLGTARGVLLRISGDVVVNETARISAPTMSIRSLLWTPDGSLWIGYAGWGLGRLKNGHLSRVGVDQGLYDDYVSQIVADDRGWLWCGGDHGIFKVRQQELEDLFAERISHVQSIHYGKGEGLPGLQTTFGLSPGALRGRDGRLWIPMRTALAVINPNKLHEDLIVPPVLLNRVAVDGRTAAWYGGILPLPKDGNRKIIDLQTASATLQLPPGHRRVEFEFAALSFSAPENVQFRYRLEGFDDGWIEPVTQRNASYSRLPAGNYHFRVKACNSDGIWNETGTDFAFTVTPFFWQTWWFRIGILGVFTSTFIGLGRYVSFRRLRLKLRALEQQTALDKERARIARDIHDDLGTRLSEITLLSELTLQDQAERDKTTEHVRQISFTVRQLTDSLDEIVWAVNPRNDTLPHLISYIGQFAMQFMQMARIRCELDLPDQPPGRGLSAEVRHNLFLVAKEALNNIVRHAHAGEVSLRITVTEDSMSMIIADNGRGFAGVPEDTSADGLRNMRQRMAEIGGECRVESQPGDGTRVSFYYPWPSR
jgi:signal transduction histidine kinase/ligand-binding sensor domain-containing protein